MRILVLHNRELRRGGEATAFEEEAAALRSRGHEVLAVEKRNADFESAGIAKKVLLAVWSLFNLPAFFHLLRVLRRFRPDVAVVHNAFPLWSTAAYFAFFARGIPVVQVVHNYRLRCLNGLYFREGAPCTLCERGRWWQGVRHRCVRGSRIWSLAYGLITQSVWPLGVVRRISRFKVMAEFVRTRLIAMGVAHEKIEVVPNFVPDLWMQSAEAAVPTWVYIGRLAPEKGIHIAVEAFALGAPGRLIVIGSGSLEGQLRERVARERLPVDFCGHVDGPQRFELLRSAWALVCPSLSFETGGPLVIREAFSVGVPVVASDVGTLPEYVIEGMNGRLVPPADPNALAQILRELAENRFERRRLADGALRETQTRLSPARVLEELEGLLARAASVGRKAPFGT